MVRTLYIRAVLAVLLVCTAASLDAQEVTLQIFHTNDTHSRIEPTAKDAPKLADRAGYVRRNTYIKKMRQQYPDLLLFDSGDYWQGTPYFNMFKGEVSLMLMQEAGYDAVALGNHEFDFGMENAKEQFEKVDFPVLCANYDFTGTPLEGVVKPYVILERKGLKIGVFALAPMPEGLIQKTKFKGVKYLNPIQVAQETADFLRSAARCDMVVCLSHLGFTPNGIDEMGDKKFVAATTGIDLVLGGHSHTYLEEPVQIKNKDGVEVTVSQMGKLGASIGAINVTLQAQ